jgi:hypothetical protein
VRHDRLGEGKLVDARTEARHHRRALARGASYEERSPAILFASSCGAEGRNDRAQNIIASAWSFPAHIGSDDLPGAVVALVGNV